MTKDSWVIEIRGRAQGVGLRPMLYRLAKRFHLNGTVQNCPSGVHLHLSGAPNMVSAFLRVVDDYAANRSLQLRSQRSERNPPPYLRIATSEEQGEVASPLPADLAVCEECLEEVFDPRSRRFCYPFTTCSTCGPRHTVIEAMPYDRERTVLRDFPMCSKCSAEYSDPDERRFHCQGITCPECGPQLSLIDEDGRPLAGAEDAIYRAAELLERGAIIAVKGIGGFHLYVDSANEVAIKRLRRKKHRPSKPFALLVPDLQWIEERCEVNEKERSLLTSPERPIVLLKRRKESEPLSEEISPRNGVLGVLTPYTPLHALLLDAFSRPLVCTSANVSGGALCTVEDEVGELADGTLTHNRRILEAVEDSVVQVVGGELTILRSARGYAPYCLAVPEEELRAAPSRPVVAVGADQKSAPCLFHAPSVESSDKKFVRPTSDNRVVWVTPQGGSLECSESLLQMKNKIERLYRLLRTEGVEWVADLHPRFLSTAFAESNGGRAKRVQHHYAHALACMWENTVKPPAICAVWDGAGLGTTGEIWGGEWLLIERDGFQRLAHLLPFSLIGGDAAAREPRRSALSLLDLAFGGSPPNEILGGFFQSEELSALRAIAPSSPRCSSMGRLFDGVGALLGLGERATYEGEIAYRLENLGNEYRASEPSREVRPYKIALSGWAPTVVDWRPMIQEIVQDLDVGESRGRIAASFHETLVSLLFTVHERCSPELPLLLSGGCFQNRLLLERAISEAPRRRVPLHWQKRVPTNDGGIAVGQVAAYLRGGR